MSDTQLLAENTTQTNEAWKLKSLTIADCGPLYERIKQGLNEAGAVRFDLTSCEEVDTAGLQLLVAIQNDPEVSLKIRWNTPSEMILKKANQLGLASWVESGILEA